jgi:hypothetical protein
MACLRHFFFTAQLYHSTRKSERVEQLKKDEVANDNKN